MKTTIQATIQKTAERFDPYRPFVTKYDKLLLEKFKAGYELVIYRGTSPWNYFLRKPGTYGTHDYLIAGKDKPNQPITVGPVMFLTIGRKVEDCGGIITRSISSREIGLPFETRYAFDAERVEAAERDWAEVAQALESHAAWPDSAELVDVRSLSPEARALMKLLQEFGGIYPYTELLPILLELTERNIVKLERAAYSNMCTVEFRLRSAYRTVSLHRTSRMKLEFARS